MWLIVVIAVTLLFTVCYAALIIYYRRLFGKLRPVAISAQPPVTNFSVIIPARNEASSIGPCLEAVFAQDYPAGLFEVIVIDDHSTDATASIVASFQQNHPNLRLVSLADEVQGKRLNAYKKKAIDIAIPKARGEWIITTDADCVAGGQWLRSFDSFIQEHAPALVAGPVKFINDGRFVSIFQCLDFLSLQGITAAAVSDQRHSMCNGANLAYKKSAFHAVNGFKGIDNVASGDDMLLMHKIKKQFPGGVGYLFSEEAIVKTTPMPDWIAFFNQRIRWASKAEKYDDRSIIAVLVLVYFYNVLLFALGVFSFFNINVFLLCLFSLTVKTLVELSLMNNVAAFYGEKRLLKWFPLMQPFHITYMVVAGWLGKFGSYRWKGRQVK